jgi:hypothetical protein
LVGSGAMVGAAAAGAVVGAGAGVAPPPQAASTMLNRTTRVTIVRRFMELLLPFG